MRAHTVDAHSEMNEAEQESDSRVACQYLAVKTISVTQMKRKKISDMAFH